MPNSTPILVTETSTNVLDTFFRGNVASLSEIRKDSPIPRTNSFEYAGIAIANSLTSDPVWRVCRISYDSRGKQIRFQFQDNISWDNRTQGW